MRDGNYPLRCHCIHGALPVVSLPMRDGNLLGAMTEDRNSWVVSLPMRDGNPKATMVEPSRSNVVSLPMRDGNTSLWHTKNGVR